ncbi:hypothetical protein AGDE_15782 [Angomonas deanei]|uniref:Eukaryotic aspartyl protease n=1 Tax=Angomonas deanei TaxID=59799 RepID=A0A7G2CPR3_9TRYP|nr:hypothetical protein AGDE_15782 [Angomonas deanei]CAD2221846.1 hypothetical protein, conserved [Angomonas deanei]|eukprot:EPY18472.1 hypothetical protein AGDE_15782 [Angomonas deanei]
MKAMRALCFVSLLFIFLCSAVHAATTTRAVFSILYSPANLFTTQYRYCLLESEAGGTTSTVCPSGREVLVNQNITWGTVIPPGIYPRNSSKVRSVLDVQYACVAYTCDMTSDFAFPIGASVSLGDAYGGFSPATPCCGPAYDTMVFDTEKREIRQMSNLPVETVNAAAERSIQSYACEGSPLPDCHIPTSKFLVKLLNPRMYPMLTTFSGPSGDGGIIFSAGVSICNQSLSTVFSYDTAAVLTVGYNVVLSMAEAVALALPWELIRYVASWIRDQPGGKTALLRSGRCHWGKDEEAVNLYRTGDYLECSLDPTMVGELPVLTLTVVRGSVVWRNFGDGEPSGSFTLDLNRLVSEDGSLRLYSTGSITNAREKRALSLYRDPFIVLGAHVRARRRLWHHPQPRLHFVRQVGRCLS